MSCAAFLVLSVLFEDAFVDSTFHITVHDEPLFLINHGNDLFQINGLVNLVLCLCIDSTNQIILFAKQFKRFLILPDQIQAVKRNQICPLITIWDSGFFSKHFYILGIHLQEQKIGELSYIIGKPNPLPSKSGSQIPYLFGE